MKNLDHSQIIHPKHQRSCFKNASTSELRDAISTLKNGTRYFSNVFSELDKEKQNTLPHALPKLSRREKKCSPISRKD